MVVGMKKNLYLSVLIIFIVCSGLFYFNSTRLPIRIGYIGSISGKYAAMGTSARNGALLAMEEINKAGGINTRPVEFIIKDDSGDPSKALYAAKELNRDGVQLIIGPLTTASATRILPYINREQILTLGPATAGENLANQDDYFIKLFPSTRTFGEYTARLSLKMAVDTISIVTDHRNKHFGESMIDGFMTVLERGGGKNPSIMEPTET